MGVEGLTATGVLTESELLGLAAKLGAASSGQLDAREVALIRDVPSPESRLASEIRRRIEAGGDPLGTLFSRIRPADDRRRRGATYTPHGIVNAMADWAAGERGEAVRVVDPGVGSGRFLAAAARRFPHAELIGVDVDPVATLLARAHLAVLGANGRARIILGDYRELALPELAGRTVFLGNPPYVRHHLIDPRWKTWLARTARLHGLRASKLAGLHVHFYLATLELARPDDLGAFITAGEWLDVNYGQLVRDLFLDGLGGRSLLMIDPSARPFPDAQTTAVIPTFEVGSRPAAIRVRRTDDLDRLAPLDGGTAIRRERLAAESRWTHLAGCSGSEAPGTRASKDIPEGYVELGEICRVHRGQVTGANKIWIAEADRHRLPECVLFPAVTRARELFQAGEALADPKGLRRVIDLPADLGELPEGEERELVEQFLRWAQKQGAHRTYVARHRAAWWSVGLREPPPILATYMARRPPAFVLNQARARFINIAHGIYPREPLPAASIRALHRHLVRAAPDARGRTYAGGLMKFEPREMERIPVPTPERLRVG